MSRYDLYIYQTADKVIDVTKIINNKYLNKEDIEFKIVENCFNPDLRGNYPGTIQLIGYFDNSNCIQKFYTTFTRVSLDKYIGVALYQTNVIANKLNHNYLHIDTDTIIAEILNSIEFFNKLITKLN